MSGIYDGSDARFKGMHESEIKNTVPCRRGYAGNSCNGTPCSDCFNNASKFKIPEKPKAKAKENKKSAPSKNSISERFFRKVGIVGAFVLAAGVAVNILDNDKKTDNTPPPNRTEEKTTTGSERVNPPAQRTTQAPPPAANPAQPEIVILNFDDATYTGEVSGNKPHGEGIMTFTDPDHLYQRYEGTFYNGKFHGAGDLDYRGGSYYRGEFLIGYQNGHGYYYNAKNDYTYEGEFFNDAFHGQGKITFSNGSYYDGKWFRGQHHGHGVMHDNKNHMTYTGEFSQNNISGSAAVEFSAGTVKFTIIGQFNSTMFLDTTNGYIVNWDNGQSYTKLPQNEIGSCVYEGGISKSAARVDFEDGVIPYPLTVFEVFEDPSLLCPE